MFLRNIFCKKNNLKTAFSLLIAALLLSGCSTTKPSSPLTIILESRNTNKYLEEDEAFLTKNEIEFSKEVKIKDKNELSYELTTLYKQRPNENFLGIPGFSKRMFWYPFSEPDDTTRLKRWVIDKLAEPPAVFDDATAYTTAETMENYLHNKGYFDAEVYHVKNRKGRKGKKVEVTYTVKSKERYLIDTVQFLSADPKVETILRQIENESFLKSGNPVDGGLYQQEVNRITTYLRNHGYAYFYPSYIDALSGKKNGTDVNIKLNVLLPNKDSLHRTYNVGEIKVYPNYDPLLLDKDYRDTTINNIRFFLKDSAYVQVNPEVILTNIYVQPGDLYRQADFDKTKKQLSSLGIFKTVNIGEVKTDNASQILDFSVKLTPNERYEVGWNAEVNTSNSPFIDAQLIGVGVGLQYKHRNLRKEAELLVINADASMDFNVRNLDSLINTVDLQLQTEYYLPKFVDYLGIWRNLNRANLIKEVFYRSLYEKASSRIAATYNFNQRIGFYAINSFDATLGYEIPPSQTERFTINHLGVDLLIPRTEPTFDTILMENPFLDRSFDRQLFTGFLLRNFAYTYSSKISRLGESYSILGSMEFSGAEIFGANKLYNAITGNTAGWEIRRRDTTSFSQFMRFDLEARVYRQLSPKQRLAFRFYSGIAIPFGFSTDVPYVKQFFVGGPNSIRAFSAREVGPGGFVDEDAIGITNPLLFYQTGDVKLELNAEYRFLAFTIFGVKYEGAIFLDAGNVWTLKYDSLRLLSQIGWQPVYDEIEGETVKVRDNFLGQMAVGTGLGFRMDFSYFLLRFDLGFPLRLPYEQIHPTTNQPYNWRPIEDYRLNDFNINIGLGYPF